MIPYKDDNPTLRRPVMTHVLVVLNILIFLLILPWHQEAVWELGFLPWELFSGQRHPDSGMIGGPEALFTSMFMHGGFLHLGGNMLFLWVFGDNIEDAMGPFKFLIFYIACGLAAHAAQLGFTWIQAGAPPEAPFSAKLIQSGGYRGPELSWFIPMVGASGAISGVMAAYYLLYPSARVRMLVPIVIVLTTITVPASFAIGYWFILQLLSGFSTPAGAGGTAWWAHIGGFLGGIVLYKPFINKRLRNQMELRRRWKRVRRQM